jgi:1-aminocyclopropane-1-carboxylate deaminase
MLGVELAVLISEDEFLHKALSVPLQRLQWSLAKMKGVEVFVRRDDLIDPFLSGNKFYKLFYNLQRARKEGYHQILSFGGAHSNHLYALAAAGRQYGFATLGVIRGERPKVLSSTLEDAQRWGMQLHFVSRADYGQKTSPAMNEILVKTYGDFYSIPEGGANPEGVQGAKALGWAIEQQSTAGYTALCLACGTGSTLAGVAAAMGDEKSTVDGDKKIIGFSVLKGEGDLGERILSHQRASVVEGNAKLSNNWRLISGYHAGGYGKKLPPNLQDFSVAFEQETNLLVDPVYTLKMCWGVAQLLLQNYWPRGSCLVLIHTGGMQGRRGFNLSSAS